MRRQYLHPVLLTKFPKTKLLYVSNRLKHKRCHCTYEAELYSGEEQASTVIDTITKPPIDQVTEVVRNGL